MSTGAPFFMTVSHVEVLGGTASRCRGELTRIVSPSRFALESSGDRPRLLVVDDNINVLQFVTGLLKDEFEIVGTAQDGASAVDSAIHLQPEVIVLDFSMPTLNGIEVIRRLRSQNFSAPVVLISVSEDPELVRTAFSAGVLGYVAKRRLIPDLIPALRSVLAGEPFVSPMVRTGDLR